MITKDSFINYFNSGIKDTNDCGVGIEHEKFVFLENRCAFLENEIETLKNSLRKSESNRVLAEERLQASFDLSFEQQLILIKE